MRSGEDSEGKRGEGAGRRAARRAEEKQATSRGLGRVRCSIADAGEEARTKILKAPPRAPPDSAFRILTPQRQRTGKVHFIPFFTRQTRYSCFYSAVYIFTSNWKSVFSYWFFPTRAVTVRLQSNRKTIPAPIIYSTCACCVLTRMRRRPLFTALALPAP